MEGKQLFKAPIWDDVRTLGKESGTFPRSFIDIIYAGFPCQDISIAGNGKGLGGERSSLYYELSRIINEIRPPFVFLENVPVITKRGGLEVVTDFTKMGYDSRWITFPASSIGASHKRERWFLLAHTQSERFQTGGQPIGAAKKQPRFESTIKHGTRDEEPANKLEVAGMANDVPYRMDRVKSLGNGVVPAQAKEAFKILMGL